MSNEFVQIMTSSLKIRDFDTIRHETWKYIIVDIHFRDMKNEKKIIFIIRREVHLINNLKCNMLFDNDVLTSKDIVINTAKKSTFIDSTEVTISLEVRSTKNVIQKSIHLKKITIVSFHSKLVVSINHLSLSNTKNFLFESDYDLNIVMYAYFIDAFISAVIVRNDKSVSIKISRNFRLDRIFEFDFFNVFHIDDNKENVRELVIKHLKVTHKNDWFKKLIFVCATTYAVAASIKVAIVVTSTTIIDLTTIDLNTIGLTSTIDLTVLAIFNTIKSFIAHFSQISIVRNFFTKSSISFEIIMPNEVTIYKSKTTDSFAKIIKNFSALWKNIEFVKMSKKNWMRISLKID